MLRFRQTSLQTGQPISRRTVVLGRSCLGREARFEAGQSSLGGVFSTRTVACSQCISAPIRRIRMPWGRLGSVWPVVLGTFEPVGPNATRVEDDIEAVSRVPNAQQVGEIEVAGPDLAVSLTNRGLIDEYQFFLHPTVPGRGSPFFAGSRPPLRLVTSDLAGESVIRLTYITA